MQGLPCTPNYHPNSKFLGRLQRKQIDLGVNAGVGHLLGLCCIISLQRVYFMIHVLSAGVYVGVVCFCQRKLGQSGSTVSYSSPGKIQSLVNSGNQGVKVQASNQGVKVQASRNAKC